MTLSNAPRWILMLVFLCMGALGALGMTCSLHLLNDHQHYHADDILLHRPIQQAQP